MSDDSLVHVCNSNPQFPHFATLYDWMEPGGPREKSGLYERITLAREMQAERQMGRDYSHLVTVIADTIKDDDGKVRINVDPTLLGVIERNAMNRVNASSKLAGQRASRRYGSKVEVGLKATGSLADQLDRLLEEERREA